MPIIDKAEHPHKGCLSDLKLRTRCSLSSASPSGLPEFAQLGNLQHLTNLSWSHYDVGVEQHPPFPALHSSTVSSICSLSQLVVLELEHQIISGSANIQLLASMPNLKQLSVRELQPEASMSHVRYNWDELKLEFFNPNFLARLPLDGIKKVVGQADLGYTLWEQGPAPSQLEDVLATLGLILTS